MGDTFTYAATLSNGSALPAWLSFDAATRTFSGTPVNGDVGAIAVKVTATDAGSATVSDTFNITVTNTNDAPTVANAIADQTIAEDSALSFQFNTNVFADVDVGDTFTYAATLSNGSALPAWLSFDAATRTFSGTPVNGDVGAIAVKVTATDAGSATVSDTFNITVTNTNDAPTVANAIADQTIAEDSALSFQFNTNVFADVDAGDTSPTRPRCQTAVRCRLGLALTPQHARSAVHLSTGMLGPLQLKSQPLTLEVRQFRIRLISL